MKKSISLISLGPGNENILTLEAKNALENAQILFGAKRLLELVLRFSGGDRNGALPVFVEEYRAKEIFDYLEKNPGYERIAVVFSGDTGFFSGAALYSGKSGEKQGYEFSVFPGISSVNYFASKLKKSWQNWKFLSLHGAKCNFIEQIRKNAECFFILSGSEDLKNVLKKVREAVLGGILPEVKCYVGKNLSYNDEEIYEINFNAGRLVNSHTEFSSDSNALFVLLVENEKASFAGFASRLEDSDFIRDDAVPMTKKDVRRLSLSYLSLSENSVFYDIGSGTGSITVEAAREATEGKIFSFECDKNAFELTKKNVQKFFLENVTCVFGKAPESLNDSEIPSPTHVFIGGSRGNLSEIVNCLLQKNPFVKIVANFVSLENLCEMQTLLKELESKNMIKKLEITQLQVSKAAKLGNFNLMKAQNPVFIVSFEGSKKM